MAQSDTTLLQAINEILVSVGERAVTSIGTFPSQKARYALNQALQDIANLNDWAFMKQSTPAVSWALDEATLPDLSRLLGVSLRPSQSYGAVYELQAVQRTDYDWYNTVPGFPTMYVQSDTNKVRVSPYPVTEEEKNNIIFHYVAALVPPATESATFPIPERFMPLLVKGAMQYLVLSHLDDANTSTFYKRQFDEMARQLIVREPGVAIGTRNMYKPVRRGRYGRGTV